MTTRTRLGVTIGAAVLCIFVTASLVCANAQTEQALELTLLKTSIRTQADFLYLTVNQFQDAFPPTTETCPTAAKNGCTLSIDVSCLFEDSYPGGSANINVTVTGPGLLPTDPEPTVPVEDDPKTGNWENSGTFRWMQRSVPPGATVTVTIGIDGEGSAGMRTETVELFKN